MHGSVVRSSTAVKLIWMRRLNSQACYFVLAAIWLPAYGRSAVPSCRKSGRPRRMSWGLLHPEDGGTTVFERWVNTATPLWEPENANCDTINAGSYDRSVEVHDGWPVMNRKGCGRKRPSYQDSCLGLSNSRQQLADNYCLLTLFLPNYTVSRPYYLRS